MLCDGKVRDSGGKSAWMEMDGRKMRKEER